MVAGRHNGGVEQFGLRAIGARACAALVAGVCASWMGGCAVIGIAGVMADTYERTGSSVVYAEYDELMGERVAVIVNTDMSIRMEEPSIDADLQILLTARLQSPNDTKGTYTGVNPVVDPETGELGGPGVEFVPFAVVRQFQLRNPSWPAWAFEDVAKELGATRLLIVDVYEYRFHEAGNAYLWDGQMSARVSVIEAEEGYVDDYAFEREIRVRFPDRTGVTRGDLSQTVVRGRLISRFIDRVGWLFYDHEEPNMIEY
ncbi:MAG: hypothetical protein ACTS3F_10475 [Phycisphaerales bacterium]